MIELLAENNFGDTRSGSLAGPAGLVIILLLAIGPVLVIRNMNSRVTLLSAGAVGAVAGIVGSFVVARGLGVGLDPGGLAMAVVAFAGSQAMRLRVRIGRDEVSIGGVEVGFTAVLCLVAAVWAPVA